jgi:hypothetical protein
MQEDKEVATKKQAVLQQLINLNHQEHKRPCAGLCETNQAGKGRDPYRLLKNLLPSPHYPHGQNELEVRLERHLLKKNQRLS